MSARLIASVPPLVNTISRASAPIARARRSCASSRASRAARPQAWADDGFPKVPPRYGSIASSDLGAQRRRRGVVEVDRHGPRIVRPRSRGPRACRRHHGARDSRPYTHARPPSSVTGLPEDLPHAQARRPAPPAAAARRSRCPRRARPPRAPRVSGTLVTQGQDGARARRRGDDHDRGPAGQPGRGGDHRVRSGSTARQLPLAFSRSVRRDGDRSRVTATRSTRASRTTRRTLQNVEPVPVITGGPTSGVTVRSRSRCPRRRRRPSTARSRARTSPRSRRGRRRVRGADQRGHRDDGGARGHPLARPGLHPVRHPVRPGRHRSRR